jgi:hypothetical protein
VPVEDDAETLLADIDRRAHIGVDRLGRDPKPLPEEVDLPVVPHEANRVVAPGRGLGEWVLGRVWLGGKA